MLKANIAAGSDSYGFSDDLDDLLSSFSSPPKSNGSSGQTWQSHAGSNSNSRRFHRYPVRWRVAIINKHRNKNDTYHGRTQNVSLSGVSILTDHNVFFTTEVVILLAIPPTYQGQKESIVEIQCSGVYTVLDSVSGQFRIGMRFDQFKGDGKRILSDVLSKRLIREKETAPADL